MMKMKAILAGLVLAFGLGGAAQAATCPGTTSTADREFTLTTQAPIGNTCFFAPPVGTPSNQQNDQTNPAFQAALAALSPAATLLGKIEYNSSGALQQTGSQGSLLTSMVALLNGSGGNFTLDLTGIVNAVLVFKVGGGQVDPKFAAFRVDSGMVIGSWSNTPTAGGGLSHVALYGAPSAVPLPATALLLLGALGGLGLMRRRKAA